MAGIMRSVQYTMTAASGILGGVAGGAGTMAVMTTSAGVLTKIGWALAIVSPPLAPIALGAAAAALTAAAITYGCAQLGRVAGRAEEAVSRKDSNFMMALHHDNLAEILIDF